MVLEAAVQYVLYTAPPDAMLCYCGVDVPGSGMNPRQHLERKDRIVAECTMSPSEHLRITACSSIEEAVNTKDRLRLYNVEPESIVVFCEWWHSWRVGLIWRHVFPGCHIRIITNEHVPGDDFNHPRMRSRAQWIAYNIAALVPTVLWLCGWNGAAKIAQPTKAS
ncbi:MAG TPA: hypothetical protein VN495_00630 [Candidatus Paceibacterota bacterium]|nr:hypothetical protein [Candidatus Paceibacterota bacterium]